MLRQCPITGTSSNRRAASTRARLSDYSNRSGVRVSRVARRPRRIGIWVPPGIPPHRSAAGVRASPRRLADVGRHPDMSAHLALEARVHDVNNFRRLGNADDFSHAWNYPPTRIVLSRAKHNSTWRLCGKQRTRGRNGAAKALAVNALGSPGARGKDGKTSGCRDHFCVSDGFASFAAFHQPSVAGAGRLFGCCDAATLLRPVRQSARIVLHASFAAFMVLLF